MVCTGEAGSAVWSTVRKPVSTEPRSHSRKHLTLHVFRKYKQILSGNGEILYFCISDITGERVVSYLYYSGCRLIQVNWLLILRNEEMWEIYEKLSSSTASTCLLGLENFSINCSNGKYQNEISCPIPSTHIGLNTRHSCPTGKSKLFLGKCIIGCFIYVNTRVGSWQETSGNLNNTVATAGNLNWIKSEFKLKVEMPTSPSTLFSPSLIRI